MKIKHDSSGKGILKVQICRTVCSFLTLLRLQPGYIQESRGVMFSFVWKLLCVIFDSEVRDKAMAEMFSFCSVQGGKNFKEIVQLFNELSPLVIVAKEKISQKSGHQGSGR